MNSKLWIKKALSSCSMVAIIATYSMVGLAAEGKVSGELLFVGKDSVVVNGENAASGRTIFSSSSIVTPDGTSATLNLGKAGQISVAPNSNLQLDFDNGNASIVLSNGSVTVISASNGVNVNSRLVAEGETATAGETASSAQTTNKKNNWWPWALVFGGAAFGILFAAINSTDNQLGGSGAVVSPPR